MPIPSSRIIDHSPAVPRLLKGLDDLDLRLVSKARELRQSQRLHPVLLEEASAHAQLVVEAARRRVVATRSGTVIAALSAQRARVESAKANLIQSRPSRARRNPGQVLQALVNTARILSERGIAVTPT